MKKNESFRNSELDRAKPKRHLFHAFINDKLKRHRSDTGLVEDRASSVTIVRIIVGLLMIHLIIIGGVLLRGQMMKDGGGGIVAPVSITPPPPPAQTAEQSQDVLPQPVVSTAPATPVAQANHITQATTANDDVAVDPDDEPVIITPPPAQAEPVRHRVAPGDSWLRIAAQYGTSEAALKAANPQAARGVLRAGATLLIPVNGAQATAQTTVATAPAEPAAPEKPVKETATAGAPGAARVHIVKSGETLSGIARKENVTVKDLKQLNNIKNEKLIRPGMKLRLSR